LYVGEEENEGERIMRTMVKEEYVMRKKRRTRKEDRVLLENKEG